MGRRSCPKRWKQRKRCTARWSLQMEHNSSLKSEEALKFDQADSECKEECKNVLEISLYTKE